MAMADPAPYQTLAVEQAGAVATVTLNRPAKRNAINARMFSELEAAFDHLTADATVRAFILTGAGGHFCSGVDVSALGEIPSSPGAMQERMEGIHRVVSKVFSCPKPGVAAVAGYAAGGGANLALACDLVVMADDAHFAELFVRRGLVMDMSGTFTLPRSIGLHRAKELALLGDAIDAARAYEIGIANRVVPAAEVTATAREVAGRLAAGPPVALALMKRALNESFSRTFDQALEQEGADQSIAFMTDDVQEAIRAFLEKREPRFTGGEGGPAQPW
jgi:enoyl-CoA hydratase/carnithine racemase